MRVGGFGNKINLKEVSNEAFNFEKEREKLEKLFEERGSNAAYDYFRGAYQKVDDMKAHDLAHFVGIELYKREGAAGLSVCDEAYNWGCYHGFFGQAFGLEGKSFLPKSEEGCRGRGGNAVYFGGCMHGVGHGVLALEGYELENLLQALADCEILSEIGAKSCYNGVFMEYNSRIMQYYYSSEAVYRQLDPSNPFEPCPKLPDKYQFDCYYELPNWWTIFMGFDFESMGGICKKIVEEENQLACFQGLGAMVPVGVNFSPDKVGETCLSMPTEAGASTCMREAVVILLIQGHKQALRLCDLLKEDFREACVKKGKEILSIN